MVIVSRKITRKSREWVVRYAPAEVLATATAVSSAVFIHNISGSLTTAAIAGALSESIGFYSYFIIRDVRRYNRSHRQHARLRRIWLSALKTVRGMAVEFGPAELLDASLVRPFCMYMGPLLLGNFTGGILVGKLLADVVFYTCAIGCYEARKRWVEVSLEQSATKQA